MKTWFAVSSELYNYDIVCKIEADRAMLIDKRTVIADGATTIKLAQDVMRIMSEDDYHAFIKKIYNP